MTVAVDAGATCGDSCSVIEEMSVLRSGLGAGVDRVERLVGTTDAACSCCGASSGTLRIPRELASELITSLC
jgi:hypothetical protein